MVSGYVWDGQESCFYEKLWKKFTQPFLELHVPYGLTIGNHDTEGDLTAREIATLDMTHPYSVTQCADFKNPATYTIQVYSNIEPETVAANIWVFDTGDYGCDGDSDGYGCIEDDQIEWYNKESALFKEQHGTTAIHLAFFHIPIPEFMQAVNQYPFFGDHLELVHCPFFNTGFFDAVKANGDISAMFVGHDHYNTYGVVMDGIEMIYGAKTGVGSYGPRRGVQHGGRVIKLRESKDANGTLQISKEYFIMNRDGTIKYDSELKNRTMAWQNHCIGPSKYFP